MIFTISFSYGEITIVKPVEIRPIPFTNDNPKNDRFENTGNILVALQPKYPLNSVV